MAKSNENLRAKSTFITTQYIGSKFYFAIRTNFLGKDLYFGHASRIR